MTVVTVSLDLASCSDPPGNLGTPFCRRWQREVGGGNACDLDMQVDAVEQRARDSRLIVCGAAWRPAAGKRGVAKMAAAAWVHCRDKLHPRRKGYVRVGASDADTAGLKRLAKRIQHWA